VGGGYGGGAGGTGYSGAGNYPAGANGAQGIIVITYLPTGVVLGPSHVQGTVSTNNNSTGQSSWSASFSAPVTSGDCVVGSAVYIEDTGTTSTLSTITDDKGNTPMLVDAPASGSGRFLQSFIFTNVTNGPITVTANTTGGTVQWTQIIMDEFSPCTLDGHNGTNAQTASSTSGNFTTARNNDTIWGNDMNNSGSANSESPGTGFTQLEYDPSAANFNMISESMTQSTAGTTAATFTRTGNFFGDTVGMGLAGMPTTRLRAMIGVGQ
jgi:hypothetical protein